MIKRVSLAAAALVGEKVFQLLAIAAANIVVLRALGPVQAGYFSAATALFAMALPLTAFGAVPIVGVLSRTSSRFQERRLVAQAVLFSIYAAICTLGVLAAIASGLEGQVGSIVVILGLALLSRPLWAVDVWYQSRHQNASAAVIRTLGVVLSAAVRIYIAATSARLDLLAWTILLEHFAIGAVLTGVYVARRGGFRFRGLVREQRHDLWRVSWPLLFSGMAVILYMRIDQPMILMLSTSSQVSFYAAATNLNDALSFLPTVAFTLLYPFLVRLFERDRGAFHQTSQRIFACAAVASYTIVLVGVLVSPTLILLLFGEEYSSAIPLLQILLLGLPFVFLGTLQTPWILMHGLQRFTLVNAYLALLLNVGLNFLVIPYYGAVGAAATTVIAHAVGGPIGNLFHPPTRPIFRQQMRALNPLYSFRVTFRLLAVATRGRR